MSATRRSRNLVALMIFVILALIAVFYFAMHRAQKQLTEEAYRGYHGLEGEMTEEERQEVIDYLTNEIESTR